ncbi:MAG: glycosyltransferase [Clostridia bacterium]|nr:glycosyltransferase [Clostridia bacterium]
MKILLSVTDSKMGGVTSAAVNFCNEMARRGHEICFLDMSAENLCKDELHQNVRLGCLRGRSVHWNLSAERLKKSKGLKKLGLYILGTIKKITIRSGLWFRFIFGKYKEFGKFDVAIAFRQCAPCYSFVLHKVKAKKKMGFVHGELKYMGNIQSWQKYMRKFDKIAYVSNAVREEFVTVYPELKTNACTIYNMFDIEKIKRMSEEKNPCNFDKSKKNIVTVARLDNEFKQIDWIPRICKKLKENEAPLFHWYVVGDGSDYDKVQALIQDTHTEDVLTLVGVKKNPYCILKDADLSVLTSKSEAYPMVVIETFILKVPLVTTEFGSIREMMREGREGFVARQNENDLVRYIFHMLRDEDSCYSNCQKHLSELEISNEHSVGQFFQSLS